jgi:RES domain-containing protein
VDFPRGLLDQIASLPESAWEGEVWRHVFGDTHPTRQNTRGARWNPPDTAAIYTSLAKEVAVAEGEYLLSMQPVPVKVQRVVFRLKVRLESVVDASSPDVLRTLGIGPNELANAGQEQCRIVGGAVAHLGHDGLLVPSARTDGVNLVIYPGNWQVDGAFDIVERIILSRPPEVG